MATPSATGLKCAFGHQGMPPRMRATWLTLRTGSSAQGAGHWPWFSNQHNHDTSQKKTLDFRGKSLTPREWHMAVGTVTRGSWPHHIRWRHLVKPLEIIKFLLPAYWGQGFPVPSRPWLPTTVRGYHWKGHQLQSQCLGSNDLGHLKWPHC